MKGEQKVQIRRGQGMIVEKYPKSNSRAKE
jgi:hypothetical protein